MKFHPHRNTFAVAMPFSKQGKKFDEGRLSGKSVGSTRTVQDVQVVPRERSKNRRKVDFNKAAITFLFLILPRSNFAA